jgi:tetratricopeptide (TPR) repeat protein
LSKNNLAQFKVGFLLRRQPRVRDFWYEIATAAEPRCYDFGFREGGTMLKLGSRILHGTSLSIAFFLTMAPNVVPAQQISLPDLPRPNLVTFSPEVRRQIEEAYAEARHDPQDAFANGRLGMVLQTYSLLQEAASAYQRASHFAPTEFRWIYYLGQVQAAAGHCDAAIVSLQSALRLDPSYIPAQLRLADCFVAAAQWDKAAELYTSVLKSEPDNAAAHYGMGRVRAAHRDFLPAADSYRKAISLFPDYGPAHYALALADRALGQLDQAEAELHLYEKDKNRVPPLNDPLSAEVRALNRTAIYHVQLGIALEQQGQLEESAAAHEKALAIDPRLVQAHINLVELYGRLGQYDKAAEHYRAAARLSPDSAENYYNFGVLNLAAEKFDQAEIAFRKTLELDPNYAGAHNNLGYLLERQGKFPEAAAEYRRAIESKPGDRQAHFNLGRVLVNQRQFDEGIRELTKTIAAPEDENTPRYTYALGAALARSGDRNSALQYLHRARASAAALGQSALVASIDRDLHTLESPGTPR